MTWDEEVNNNKILGLIVGRIGGGRGGNSDVLVLAQQHHLC